LDEGGVDDHRARGQQRDPVLSAAPRSRSLSSHAASRDCLTRTADVTERPSLGYSEDRVLQTETLPTLSGTDGDIELSVVVPLCNEEESIAPLVESVCAALKEFGKPWELIIVDDGSTDATLVNARKQIAREGL